MNIKQLQKNWDSLGRADPFWAILAWPGTKGNQWRLEEFFRTGTQEIASIMEYLKALGLESRRNLALDFGCGVGRLTQALAEHFDHVKGVDIAPSMLKLARKNNRFGDRCTYHLNDRDDLAGFADGSCDLIYTNIVLQHVRPEYTKRYLREFLRLLAPDGVLIFQLPSERTRDAVLRLASLAAASEQQSPPPTGGLRQLIKRLTPEPLVRLYRGFRATELTWEMHGIQQDEVERLLSEHGGQIVDRVENEAAGPDWISIRYCVTKKSSTPYPG